MIKTVKSIWIYFAVCLILTLTLGLIPIILVFGNRAKRTILSFWEKMTVYSLQCHVEIDGKDRLPDKNVEKVLYVSNHSSLIDIPLLFGFIDATAAFVSKKSVLYVPVIGLCLLATGGVLLSRKPSRKELKKFTKIRERLEKGHRYFLFPEGTRTKTGKLGEFKAVKRLLDVEGLLVQPLYISGSYDIIREGRFQVEPGTIGVTVGQPIMIQRKNDFEVSQSKHKTLTAKKALEEIEIWMKEIENTKK